MKTLEILKINTKNITDPYVCKDNLDCLNERDCEKKEQILIPKYFPKQSAGYEQWLISDF
jgi:hypothetical protein